MREKRNELECDFTLSGITPAYAGKTLIKRTCSSTTQDHPRVCGKNEKGTTMLNKDLGSPPRMREKPPTFLHSIRICRITPAYAGKTERLKPKALLCWDHPRVCGKNGIGLFTSHNCPGSPPRMREKPYLDMQIRTLCRITPEYAGKTQRCESAKNPYADHPRVCGKNQDSTGYDYAKKGSPPRMREKQTPKRL